MGEQRLGWATSEVGGLGIMVGTEAGCVGLQAVTRR